MEIKDNMTENSGAYTPVKSQHPRMRQVMATANVDGKQEFFESWAFDDASYPKLERHQMMNAIIAKNPKFKLIPVEDITSLQETIDILIYNPVTCKFDANI